MSIGVNLALWEGIGQPIQWLAIVGGGALGAFATGAAAQVLSRWLTTRKLPPFGTLVVRGIGGVVVGLLTAMFVLQGGTWGLGGAGGTPGTEGTGQPPNPDKGPVADDNKPTPENKDDNKPTAPGTVVALRVEVLNDPAIEKLSGGLEAIAGERYYWLAPGPDANSLVTLAKVEEAIKKRLDDKPRPQRLDIVGPDKTAGRVFLLSQWADERGLKVDYLPR